MPATPPYASSREAARAFLGDINNRDNNFLRSVYESSQAYNGSLTTAQDAAVRRIMVERGWRFDATGWVPPAGTAEPMGEPASCGEGRNIPNGMFNMNAGGALYKFRIFTIVRTSNAGLMNKRVMSYFDPDTEDWSTFAFLTTTGRLKVWRRFQDESSESWQLAARQLLNMLRQPDGMISISSDETDALGVQWSYTVSAFTCHYCADGLMTSERAAGHNSCANYRRNRPAADAVVETRVTDWNHGPAPRIVPPGVRRTREVCTPSQVTGLWEQ